MNLTSTANNTLFLCLLRTLPLPFSHSPSLFPSLLNNVCLYWCPPLLPLPPPRLCLCAFYAYRQLTISSTVKQCSFFSENLSYSLNLNKYVDENGLRCWYVCEYEILWKLYSSWTLSSHYIRFILQRIMCTGYCLACDYFNYFNFVGMFSDATRSATWQI